MKTRVLAVMECPRCGAWREISVRWLAGLENVGHWGCAACGGGFEFREFEHHALALDDLACRLYDLWLDGFPQESGWPAGGRIGMPLRVDVRPFLEPLL